MCADPRRPLCSAPLAAFAILLGGTWLAVCAGLLMAYWGQTGQTLLDTDDAMRLVQLRAFLDRQSWFDLHQPRLQPPTGYDTHWSRLIDAGLAGPYLLFRAFADHAFAERLLRALWPLLWLLPTMAGVAAIAWRLGGEAAGRVVLLLMLAGVPAYQQFTPGRIDHHNVQIALTVLAVAATVWSDRRRWAALAAGSISGLALAIGFESLPYIAACGVALALRFVVQGEGGGNEGGSLRALQPYALGLLAATSLGFVLNVAPARWGETACDALAANALAGVSVGAVSLAMIAALPLVEWRQRLIAVGLAGAAAFAAGALGEPRCLAGPYAMVDPAIWPVWLAEVRENQPLFRVFALNPLTATGIAAFPALGCLAVLALLRPWQGLREGPQEFALGAASAVFLVAAATTVGAIRAYSYAMWLGMPLVAMLTLRVYDWLGLTSLRARLLAAATLTPAALSSGAITLAVASGFEDRESFARPHSAACFRTQSFAPLAQLPPGLVVADVSYGPFLLALTPHSVLGAPYHRLSAGILTAHNVLALPPTEARKVLQHARVDYVVICGRLAPLGLDRAALAASLWGALQVGAVPEWLDHVAGGQGEPFSAYRVR